MTEINAKHGIVGLEVVNKLPFNPLKMNKDEYDRMVKNFGGIQFSHSMEEQLGAENFNLKYWGGATEILENNVLRSILTELL